MKALSIRQPWAWLIVNGYKDVENRTWPTEFRGRFLVHAAKGMTCMEYESCALDLVSDPRIPPIDLPPFEKLERGGIVGVATLSGCSDHNINSVWFSGPFGFVIENAKPVSFYPCRGMLGFFHVEFVDES